MALEALRGASLRDAEKSGAAGVHRRERRQGPGRHWAFAGCVGDFADLNSNGKALVYKFMSPVLFSCLLSAFSLG